MDRIKVQDNSNLERDLKSNGIVNTNRQAYDLAKKRAKQLANALKS